MDHTDCRRRPGAGRPGARLHRGGPTVHVTTPTAALPAAPSPPWRGARPRCGCCAGCRWSRTSCGPPGPGTRRWRMTTGSGSRRSRPSPPSATSRRCAPTWGGGAASPRGPPLPRRAPAVERLHGVRARSHRWARGDTRPGRRRACWPRPSWSSPRTQTVGSHDRLGLGGPRLRQLPAALVARWRLALLGKPPRRAPSACGRGGAGRGRVETGRAAARTARRAPCSTSAGEIVASAARCGWRCRRDAARPCPRPLTWAV